MNQIPNIEETHSTREIEYFRWRDELMSLLKKIRENIAFSKSKLWDYTNDDLIEDLCAKIEQKAREEERERNVKLINNIIQQSSDDSSDSWFNALRCARETIAHHSELDQDKK